MSRLHHTAGFTLLEVLIAIVVLSFGLLGIAGLQVVALKNNQSASMRSVAVALSTDIVERMKANVQGMVNGDYDKPLLSSYGDPGVRCTAARCEPPDLAAYDRWQWQQAVAAALPGGQAIICKDATTPGDGDPGDPKCSDIANGNQYVIKIWWTDERNKRLDTTKLLFWTAFNP